MAFDFFKNLIPGRSRPEPQPPAPQPAPPGDDAVPMAIPLTHNEQFLVDGGVLTMASTNVEEMSWDVDTQTLTVGFLSGDVYQYFGVPLDVAVAFIETDSPGRFVWSHLRDVYPYRRVQKGLGPRKKPQVVRLVNR